MIDLDREAFDEAYSILAGIPADRFAKNLKFIANGTNPNDCGTLACGIGWLAMHPRFSGELELKVNNLPFTEHQGRVYIDSYDEAAARVFNIDEDEAHDLFCSRGFGNYDLEGHATPLDDKALILYRFLRFIGEPPKKASLKAIKDSLNNWWFI